MELCALAVENGFTLNSSPLEIASIAGKLVDEYRYPQSVYDTTRSLMRIQREGRIKEQAGAA